MRGLVFSRQSRSDWARFLELSKGTKPYLLWNTLEKVSIVPYKLKK